MEDYLILSNRDRAKFCEYMLSENDILRIATYFQNFSDSTRLKIIISLTFCDMCVKDLSKLLAINQTTISHQLKILKSQNIVEFRRYGKILIYSLCDKKIKDIMYLGIS